MTGRWDDPQAQAEFLGQVPRLVPGQQWGNPGATGRAGTAIGWSAANVQIPGAVVADQFRSVLKFSSPDGAPHLWNVTAQASKGALNKQGASRKGMSIKLRWTLGAVASEAIVDFASGSASFQLACDAVDMQVANLAFDIAAPTDSDIVVAAAVSHASGVAASRTARRTLYGTGADTFQIPAWSQQWQVVAFQTDGLAGAYTLQVLDSASQVLQVIYLATGTTSYTLMDLPSGAAQINFLSGADGKTAVGLCFVLGF